MDILQDLLGNRVRLTDERLAHILEHPEMTDMVDAIAETLASPNRVMRSTSDLEVSPYYRFYETTQIGEKYLCVAVKPKEEDAFVLTAYLTNTIKRGEPLWPENG